MDTTLSDSQVKQLSLSISINDVLNCIRKDIKGYLEFINDELKNNEITQAEYEKELMLIERLKNEHREEAEDESSTSTS